MLDIKPIITSRTIVTNIVIGIIGLSSVLGILPDACSADNVAANLGVAVPTLVGTVLTGLAALSSYFRVKATAALV